MVLKSLATTLVFATALVAAGSNCPDGQTEMSVEGVEGIFCLSETPVCVADIVDGACPGPQEGLEFGAHCGKVASGVYGCKKNDQAPESAPAPAPSDNGCGDGESPMSVEGVEGSFCVSEPACVADNADGACPGPQEGLELGAHCGKVASGVYGCKKNKHESTQAPEIPDESDDSDDSEESEKDDSNDCHHGESPMSVEGVDRIFCVPEPSCVDDIADGACPGPQEGLEFGAYCGVVDTGVYGCKPYDNETEIIVTIEPWHPDEPETLPPVSDVDCSDSEHGETAIYVEGQGTFCAFEPVCDDDVLGNCPQAQDGLKVDSVCGHVDPGVFGCFMP